MGKRVELKKCPFCGGTPVVNSFIREKTYYAVSCENAKCRIQPSTDYHTARHVVVREWNRRNEEKQEVRK